MLLFLLTVDQVTVYINGPLQCSFTSSAPQIRARKTTVTTELYGGIQRICNPELAVASMLTDSW